MKLMAKFNVILLLSLERAALSSPCSPTIF